jgi:hypothetical protein
MNLIVMPLRSSVHLASDGSLLVVQAATVLGALAAAEPSSAASMLGDMMGKLSAAAPRLAAMRAPGKGEPPVSGNKGEAFLHLIGFRSPYDSFRTAANMCAGRERL